MKRGSLSLIILLVLSSAAFAEVTCVVVKNEDKTKTRIFYSEGKEIGQIALDANKNIVKTTGTIPDGIVKQYLSDGTLKFAWNFKNGKREGLSKKYFKSGELVEDILFVNDKREGISKKYYKSGKVFTERNFKNGILDGMTKIYYESGKNFAEVNYKDDMLEGDIKVYYETGELKSVETYKNNKKIKVQSYNKKGELIVDREPGKGNKKKKKKDDVTLPLQDIIGETGKTSEK